MKEKKCNRCGEYKYTFRGYLTQLYSSQKSSSKKRGHQPPNYTKEELGQWIKSQPNFQKLWDNWIMSNYDKMLFPSCDRTSDKLGYDLNRLQLLSWREHRKKTFKDMREGKLVVKIKPQKPVMQMDLNGNFIEKFISIREAERQTNISSTSISLVCLGKQKKDGLGNYYTPQTAGGFKWKYNSF